MQAAIKDALQQLQSANCEGVWKRYLVKYPQTEYGTQERVVAEDLFTEKEEAINFAAHTSKFVEADERVEVVEIVEFNQRIWKN